MAADVARFLDVAWSDLRGAVLDAENRTARVRVAGGRSGRRGSPRADGAREGSGAVRASIRDASCGTLQRLLPPNAIITTDAGNFGGWLARGYRFLRPGTFLGPTSGAMGYGLPAAIAASLVHPDRPVVAVCGDGGFAMTMAELETSVREGARPVVIVLDNQGYGTIRMHQDRHGRPHTSRTDLGPIDFARRGRRRRWLAPSDGVRAGVRTHATRSRQPSGNALAARRTSGHPIASIDRPTLGDRYNQRIRAARDCLDPDRPSLPLPLARATCAMSAATPRPTAARPAGGRCCAPIHSTCCRTSPRTRLLDLGLRQVIDLRWPSELEAAPSVFQDSDRVRYTNIPLLADDPTPHVGLAGMYRHIFDERAAQLVEVVRALLEPDGAPAVIGCAAGKDRTGVAIALILASSACRGT